MRVQNERHQDMKKTPRDLSIEEAKTITLSALVSIGIRAEASLNCEQLLALASLHFKFVRPPGLRAARALKTFACGQLNGEQWQRPKSKRETDREFYLGAPWRKLRMRVLEKYGARCMVCGRNHKDHGVVIHVDHIKPRAKHPELELVFDNLQVMCEDCNIGKGRRYSTDWRRPT